MSDTNMTQSEILRYHLDYVMLAAADGRMVGPANLAAATEVHRRDAYWRALYYEPCIPPYGVTTKSWPLWQLAWLTVLWDEGAGAKQIARMLAISKNAIIGMAHRLHLTPRPSPIRPRDPNSKWVPKGRKARHVPAVLPPLVSQPSVSVGYQNPNRPMFNAGSVRFTPYRPHDGRTFDEWLEDSPPPPPRAKPVPTPVYKRVITCQLVTNDGRPLYSLPTYCDLPSVPGKSYCADHQLRKEVRGQDPAKDNGFVPGRGRHV